MPTNRRAIIGVVGGDGCKAEALQVGKRIAECGCILLTGGSVEDNDEVKNAAMVGAVEASNLDVCARLIGILSGGPKDWIAQGDHKLFLKTGLPHNVRNIINGLTPDKVIVFGGSKGTLAEAAFALYAEKPVVICDTDGGFSARRLANNFSKYFGSPNKENNDEIERKFLRLPIDEYHSAWKNKPSVVILKTILYDFLMRAKEVSYAPSVVVDHCLLEASDFDPGIETGFPGLPGDILAKTKFESIVQKISL